MAVRPELHIAVAKHKSKASDYNDNFERMMDFVDASIAESKDYVEGYMPSMTGQAGKILSTDGTNAVWLDLFPAGFVVNYAGSYAPTGWLVCDGSEISRTTYSNLYSAIGDTYGEGDGSTTFNLPDLIDRFVEGSTTVGTEKDAGIPNITGGINELCTYGGGPYGVFYNTSFISWKKDGRDQTLYHGNYVFDASRASSVYSNDITTVQPPAVTMLPVIKY